MDFKGFMLTEPYFDDDFVEYLAHHSATAPDSLC
jgi:hypothetical protein